MIVGMASKAIPEPWYTAMLEADMVSTYSGLPAVAPLARETELTESAIHNIIHGRVTTPTANSIRRLASALHVTPATVAKWVGSSWGANSTWTPPAEAQMLTTRERRAVEELIRCLAASRTAEETPKRTVRGKRPVPKKRTS